ncbi:hypothetical protein FGB62_62g012 [Gracilaria domingensis]|nr:hypothetical protein FGB62_62g012 [Gracilaria domingensis]
MGHSPEYRSQKYTFMLKHKHFDFNYGEVLFVETVGKEGYDVCVKRRADVEEHFLPCMWIFSQQWLPFAYTAKEWGCKEYPNRLPGDYNIGLRWLNDEGLEETNEYERIQWVRRGQLDGEGIVTFRNCQLLSENDEENSKCIPSECEPCVCRGKNGSHRWAHSRVHPKKTMHDEVTAFRFTLCSP